MPLCFLSAVMKLPNELKLFPFTFKISFSKTKNSAQQLRKLIHSIR